MSVDKSSIEQLSEVKLWLRLEEIDSSYRNNTCRPLLLELQQYASAMIELRRRGVTRLSYHEQLYDSYKKRNG